MNVEQVANVCQNTIARDAWNGGGADGARWIYGLHDGLLRDLNVQCRIFMRHARSRRGNFRSFVIDSLGIAVGAPNARTGR